MLPFFAISIPILVLLCGLTLDVGLMEIRSVAMQSAADAAALGAELEQERGGSDWAQLGLSIAALNGFTDGSGNTAVSVTQRPSSGAFAGNYDAVEIRVASPVNTIFMRFLNPSTVRVRSVALIPPCVFLGGNPSNPGATLLSATSSILTLACPAYSNGPVLADSTSTLSATAWNLTSTSGPISGGGGVSPTPHPNAYILADPLAALAPPAIPSCMQTGFTQTGGSVSLFPGTYCGGLTLSNTTATLSPGLYILTGGAHWSHSIVRGSGVTLFLTQGGGSSFGQFLIDANSQITLAAPTDASANAIPGVLLMADRGWVPTSSFDLQVRDSTVQADGIWYSLRSGLLLSNSTLRPRQYLALDTSAITLSSSQLKASGDFSSVTTGSPFRPLGGLVE